MKNKKCVRLLSFAAALILVFALTVPVFATPNVSKDDHLMWCSGFPSTGEFNSTLPIVIYVDGVATDVKVNFKDNTLTYVFADKSLIVFDKGSWIDESYRDFKLHYDLSYYISRDLTFSYFIQTFSYIATDVKPDELIGTWALNDTLKVLPIDISINDSWRSPQLDFSVNVSVNNRDFKTIGFYYYDNDKAIGLDYKDPVDGGYNETVYDNEDASWNYAWSDSVWQTITINSIADTVDLYALNSFLTLNGVKVIPQPDKSELLGYWLLNDTMLNDSSDVLSWNFDFENSLDQTKYKRFTVQPSVEFQSDPFYVNFDNNKVYDSADGWVTPESRYINITNVDSVSDLNPLLDFLKANGKHSAEPPPPPPNPFRDLFSGISGALLSVVGILTTIADFIGHNSLVLLFAVTLPLISIGISYLIRLKHNS